MGSPSGGASSSGNDSGGGSSSSGSSNSGNSTGSSGAGNNDRDSSNDRSSSQSSRTSHSGKTESERGGASRSDKDTFGGAMSDAAASAGSTLGGLSSNNPATHSDAEQAAQNSLASHANEFSGLDSSGGPVAGPDVTAHANEFSGIGPSGGPLSNNDSLNSHRGYGPDNSVAGGIDQTVNAAMAAKTDQEKAAQDTDAADLIGSAGYGAAGLQGGLEAYRDHIDRGARSAAAGTLTRGPGGSLPAPGYANRADLGRTITDPRMTAGRALDATPFGPNARSTQQLSTGAGAATTVGRLANGVGLGIQPAAGAIQGYANTPEDASWAERATNTVIGAVKEVDDTAISYGAGLGAGSLAIAGSVLTGPAAPAVAASAPAVGVAAAIGAGEFYNNNPIDRAVDGFVEDYARPALQGTFNAIDDYVVDPISDLFNPAAESSGDNTETPD